MDDTALFCPACGQKQEPVDVAAPETNSEREKAFYIFRRNLRHERKCWTIFGNAYLGFTIFFGVLSAIFLPSSIANPYLIGIGLEYLLITVLVFLPFTIIAKIMASKLDRYLYYLETDPNPAVERCGAVWPIVIGALFNELSLIFIIQNFVHVKTKRDLLVK